MTIRSIAWSYEMDGLGGIEIVGLEEWYIGSNACFQVLDAVDEVAGIPEPRRVLLRGRHSTRPYQERS